MRIDVTPTDIRFQRGTLQFCFYRQITQIRQNHSYSNILYIIDCVFVSCFLLIFIVLHFRLIRMHLVRLEQMILSYAPHIDVLHHCQPQGCIILFLFQKTHKMLLSSSLSLQHHEFHLPELLLTFDIPGLRQLSRQYD